MLFQETDRPDVFTDETGKMWPLGQREITQLRNNGMIVPRNQSGSGGGGAKVGMGPAWAPNPIERPGAPTGPAAPAKVGIGPMVTATAPANGGYAPLPGPVKRDFEAVPQGGGEWQFNGQPRTPSGVQTLPSQPMRERVSTQSAAPDAQPSGPGQIQRVMPRGNPGQQSSSQQRIYKQVGGTPGGWVDTARQTSGWSPEEQDAMRARAAESHKLRTDAANMQYESKYREFEADKFRAEADKAESFNRMTDEQRKLDTQNLYIESQQKKVAEKLKAAREREVDPNKPFQGVGGGIAGVLAVLGSALGQYSAGINGGPNNALTLFNNMIDRSVNEQLRLIEEGKEGALMEKAELDDFRFMNNEEKKALIRSIELENNKAKLDSIMADKNLAAVHPMAAQMRADVDDKQTQDLITINNATNRTAGQAYQQAQAGGRVDVTEQVLAGQARESGYKKTIRENEEAANGGMIGEASIVAPDGTVIGKAPSAARAEKLNERIAAQQEFENAGTELLDIIKEHEENSTLGIRDEGLKARYASAAQRFKSSGWKVNRSDAPTKEEGDDYANSLGGLDLANLRTGRQATIVKRAIDSGRENTTGRIQQHGGDPSYLRRRKPNPKDEGYTP